MSISFKTALNFIRFLQQEPQLLLLCYQLIDLLKKNLEAEPVILILIEKEELKFFTVRDNALVILPCNELELNNEELHPNLAVIEQIKHNRQIHLIDHNHNNSLELFAKSNLNINQSCHCRYCYVPIQNQQNLLGLLYLETHNFWSEDTINFIELVIEQTATVIAQCRFCDLLAQIEDSEPSELIVSRGSNHNQSQQQLGVVASEIALIRSQQQYKNLAAAAPVGIFHTDAEGNCLYVNERWSEIAGLTLEQAKGTGWIQGIYPDDRHYIFQTWYEAAQKNIPFRAEYRFQNASGEVHWVFGVAVAEYDTEGKLIGYIGTITDINERKQAEARLELHNQQLKREIELRKTIERDLRRKIAAIETANIGIAILKDDRYTYLNQTHAQVYGYQVLELLNQNWRNLYYPEQIAQLEAEVFPILQKHNYWRGHTPAKHKNGKVLDTEVILTYSTDGDLIYVCQDISNRLKAEKELQEAKEKAEQANQAKSQFLANMSRKHTLTVFG